MQLSSRKVILLKDVLVAVVVVASTFSLKLTRLIRGGTPLLRTLFLIPAVSVIMLLQGFQGSREPGHKIIGNKGTKGNKLWEQGN